MTPIIAQYNIFFSSKSKKTFPQGFGFRRAKPRLRGYGGLRKGRSLNLYSIMRLIKGLRNDVLLRFLDQIMLLLAMIEAARQNYHRQKMLRLNFKLHAKWDNYIHFIYKIASIEILFEQI